MTDASASRPPFDPASFDPAKDLAVCILAGGAGTRFWPASTRARPKQLLPLKDGQSLLKAAYERVAPMVPNERILVLTSHDLVAACAAELEDLPQKNIIGEPMRRDTSAAVALAAAVCEHRFGDGVMAVLTADHIIEPAELFRADLVSAAKGAATSDALYTFGIPPTSAATGFGYLELGDDIASDDDVSHRQVQRFVEKPNKATAETYLAAGNYRWNSGMFCWRTQTIANNLDRHVPAHLEHLRPAVQAWDAGDDDALARGFEPLEKISIDYAVMEKADDVRCVSARFNWSDVGGFVALADHLPRDASNNAHRGRLASIEANNNVVYAQDDGELIALIGVDDLVVVRSEGRTLVAPKARAEEIKALVAKLDDSDT